ncbi:MAG: hypothetical protein ACQERF_03560 [Actinomycetota bacterium]
MGAASFNIGAKKDVVENSSASPVGNWEQDTPATIDDCSVFLAYGSRDDPTVVDCVGVEIRSADFEMPPFPYFLMNATGEVIDRADIPVVVTLAEFQSLPIDGGVLEMQPAAAQVLVNIETVAWSTARTHILGTTILGTPVAVRATPVQWSWDFGAGTEPFVTTTPGGPYPNLAVSRVYARTAASQSIGLTVTWTGEYQVNGAGPWLPIAGTTTTSSASPPFDVVEAPARLVVGALDEG